MTPESFAPAPANQLLRRLSKADLAALRPRRVDLIQDEVLYEPGDPVTSVYFPEAGMLSIIDAQTRAPNDVVNIVGKRGAVGYIEACGTGEMKSRVVVRMPGWAWAASAARFCATFNESEKMRSAVLAQIETSMVENRLSLACVGQHTIEQRLAGSLVECQENAGGLLHLPLTHADLSDMLGYRRTSITEAAVAFRKQGLISYTRGRIQITEPDALEAAACACFATRPEPPSKLDS